MNTDEKRFFQKAHTEYQTVAWLPTEEERQKSGKIRVYPSLPLNRSGLEPRHALSSSFSRLTRAKRRILTNNFFVKTALPATR